jgi:galactokinase
VAWARFLIELSPNPPSDFLKPEFIARMAWLAEVQEFSEPGGMMDHYACALGNVLYQDFTEPLSFGKIPKRPGTFVLGDSMQPKDTLSVLSRAKQPALEGQKTIKRKNPDFDLKIASIAEINKYVQLLSEKQLRALEGAILNRDITVEAMDLFRSENFDKVLFGHLLTEHQKILSDYLDVSTPKLDHLLKVALDAGALGGKINGSGGGGCMFVYAPGNPSRVAEAIEKAGGKAYVIHTDTGLQAN